MKCQLFIKWFLKPSSQLVLIGFMTVGLSFGQSPADRQVIIEYQTKMQQAEAALNDSIYDQAILHASAAKEIAKISNFTKLYEAADKVFVDAVAGQVDSLEVLLYIATNAKEIAEKQRDSITLLLVDVHAQRQQAARSRLLALAQDLMGKSELVNKPALRARLVLLGYKLHLLAEGYAYDRAIFRGLYYGLQHLEENPFPKVEHQKESHSRSKAHRSAITSITFDANGEKCISQSVDRVSYEWTFQTERLLQFMEVPFQSSQVAELPIQSIQPLAQAETVGGLKAHISETGEVFLSDSTLQFQGFSLAFNPKRSQVAIGEKEGGVLLWNYAENDTAYFSEVHTTTVSQIAFDSNGEFMATGGYDGQIYLWNLKSDVEKDRIINQLPIVLDDNEAGNYVTALTFHPHSNFLLAGYHDGTIRAFPTKSHIIAAAICSGLGPNQSQLSHAEWNQYVSLEETIADQDFISLDFAPIQTLINNKSSKKPPIKEENKQETQHKRDETFWNKVNAFLESIRISNQTPIQVSTTLCNQ